MIRNWFAIYLCVAYLNCVHNSHGFILLCQKLKILESNLVHIILSHKIKICIYLSKLYYNNYSVLLCEWALIQSVGSKTVFIGLVCYNILCGILLEFVNFIVQTKRDKRWKKKEIKHNKQKLLWFYLSCSTSVFIKM